jgi:AcrR family transcriptional regulator
MARRPTPPAREPRWRRLDADERRTQILECARRAFTQRAYASVSMSEIAACAGVRRGLLHHYFGGKHDLYVAVVRDLLARFEDVVEPVDDPADADAGDVAGGDGEPATLEQLVDVHVDRWLGLVEQQAEAWFALIDVGAAPDVDAGAGAGADVGDHDPEVARLIRRARAAMVDGIATALGMSAVTAEAQVVLRSYAGLAEVATREWLKRHSLDRAQVHALLVTTMVALLREVVPAVEAAGTPRGRQPGTDPAAVSS